MLDPAVVCGESLVEFMAEEAPADHIAADTDYLYHLVRSTTIEVEATESQAVKMELESLEMQRQEAEGKHRQVRPLLPGVSAEESSRSALSDSGDKIEYWKHKANTLSGLLAQSLRRQDVLQQKIQDAKRSHYPSELQGHLGQVSSFLHLALRNAPLNVAHLDEEFRYRFIYNNNSFHGLQAREAVKEIKLRAVESGAPVTKEVFYDIPGVGPRTFLLYVHPVYMRNRGPLGFNVIHMDITEEVANREELIRIREQTTVHKAMQAECSEATQKTEQRSKAKQLLATMSHEIRSPLSGVVSIAELLGGADLDAEQQHLVDVMVASGDLVLQLLNDILDLAKADSGLMKLDETHFFPREIVKDALQIAAASLGKSLHLEALVSNDVPLEVLGDLLRFRRILTNLISNAIKFTHEGTVQVNLRVSPDHVREDAAVWLECEVMDTGIGIPENALSFLFTQYMQASETHHRKYGGTGLGLAICKQLVELMGGQLRVRSKENEGSTFYFTVPFKLPGKQSAQKDNGPFRFFPVMPRLKKRLQPPVLQEQAASSRCQKQLKVLLAEDNMVNIMIAEKMLRRFGLEAKVVDNGVEALEAVREEHYDLILMDVYMPHMDGLEATRLIREYQSFRNKRSCIVAMTASTFDEAECYAQGVDWFVTKPISFDKIKTVIQHLAVESQA